MRTPAEIFFRLRQEAANLAQLSMPPRWGEPLDGPLECWPAPQAVAARVRGSALASHIEELAEEIMRGRYRLLGLDPVDLPSPVRWRRDFVHGRETGLDYFRSIPYLDFARAGDHKIVWELNRHQHLVILAQAYALTGRRAYMDTIQAQVEHWIAENPFQRGINWASALEVGFRTLSWLWVLHLTAGAPYADGFRKRWMQALYRHGLHLEYNLSVYFSPNTHLLGEAVALHALGRLCPSMPRAARWRDLGRETVQEQMRRQVRDDGSHFEQSSYYHLYAVNFFLLHLVLEEDTPSWYREKLAAMVELLDALVSSRGILPFLGDDDGGRLFFPYGDRRRFAVATLSTCAQLFGKPEWVRDPDAALEQAAWWLPEEPTKPATPAEPRSRWFADTGLVILLAGGAHAIFDAGPFGAGSAGHSHADTLALIVFRDGEEYLIDPGSFTYTSDPTARQQFRGIAAHNTLCVDSVEQATPAGPFRWDNPPEVELLHRHADEHYDAATAECRYSGFTHRRSVVLVKADTVIVVVDRILGAGPCRVEQRWLCAEGAEGNIDTLPPPVREPAERSIAFGSRQAAVRVVSRYEGSLPATLVAAIGIGAPARLRRVVPDGEDAVIEYEGGSVRVSARGAEQAG